MPLFMHTPRIRFPVRAALRAMVAALVFLIPGLVLMGGPAALTDLTLYERFCASGSCRCGFWWYSP